MHLSLNVMVIFAMEALHLDVLDLRLRQATALSREELLLVLRDDAAVDLTGLGCGAL